jgi:hypothetical protein
VPTSPSGAETLPRNFKLKRSSSSQYKLGKELSKFMQIVMDEIIEESPDCSFSMVAGQQSAKQALQVCTVNATTTFLIVIAKYFSIS